MADKKVSELVAATSVTASDLFVLEQSGTAKKLTGQILENWLVSFADGHGGIQSVVKSSTSGLEDTYTGTLADQTTFTFTVTNGKGISKVERTGTSGLVDTYTITYNDSTTGTFTVTNGAKGAKGDNMYVWIRYASQEPSASAPTISVLPDDWMGMYSGAASTAPASYADYTWYKIKGDKGDTGAAATATSVTTYQASASGTITPDGEWSAAIPTVAQGGYLWTRTVVTFNDESSYTAYSVGRMGIDGTGTGTVTSVNGAEPDADGNVELPIVSSVNGSGPGATGDVTVDLTETQYTTLYNRLT